MINKIINLLFQRVVHWPDNYNTKKKKLQGVSFTLCNIHVTVQKKRNVRRLFFFPLPCAMYIKLQRFTHQSYNLKNTDACLINLGNLAIMSIQRSVFKPMFSKEYPELHKFYKPTTASDWHKCQPIVFTLIYL